jgi:hypothetical protein
MPLTKIETELRQRARHLIETGDLPGSEPRSIAGGYGHGGSCSLCTHTIDGAEVEYEVEVGGKAYQFHFMCHAAWSFECARAAILANQAKRPDDGSK